MSARGGVTMTIDTASLRREAEALRAAVLRDQWARGRVESLLAQGVPMYEILPVQPGARGSYRQQLTDAYWGVLEAAIEGAVR